MNNEEMKRLKQEILLDLMVCYDTKKLRKVLKVLREEPKDRTAAIHTKYQGFGEEHTNAEWARRLGMRRNTLWRNLQKGLTIEQVAEIRGIKYPQK